MARLEVREGWRLTLVYTETIKVEDKVSGSVKAARTRLAEMCTTMDSAQGLAASLSKEFAFIGAAAGGIAVGIGAAAFKVAEFAIEASGAKTKMLSMFDALGEGKITGQQVDDLLDNMRDKLGVTKDAMVPFAQAFVTLGVTGETQLEKLVTAAASAGAMAEGGGDAFVTMFKKIQTSADLGQALKIPVKGLGSLAAMGLNVTDIAKKMGVGADSLGAKLKAGLSPDDARAFGDAMQVALVEKGAKPLATMANSAHNLAKLGLEYLGDLFEDLGKDIAPFMAAVKELFGLIDSKSTASGRALKEGIGVFFKEAFAAATKVVPYVKMFLLDIVILGLRAYISLKPLSETFDSMGTVAKYTATNIEELANKFVTSDLAMQGLKMTLEFIVYALGAVVAIIGIGIAITGAFVAAFVALSGAAFQVGEAIGTFLKDSVAALGEWVKAGPQAATDFIQGLANGLANGAGLVIDAAKSLGNAAIGSVKDALGIHSPSTVMIEAGQFTGEGFAQGMEATVPDVHDAAGSLGGAAAPVMATPPPDASASGAGGGVTVIVEPGAIVLSGGSGASASELTESAVSLLFERCALAAGLGT